MAGEGQIAVEVDEAARLVTLVYFGAVTDEQVKQFYIDHAADFFGRPGFGFLLDLRHTNWISKPETVQFSARLLQEHYARHASGPDRRRIAIVRRGQPEVHALVHGKPMREGFGDERLRYFDSMDAARAWIREGQTA